MRWTCAAMLAAAAGVCVSSAVALGQPGDGGAAERPAAREGPRAGEIRSADDLLRALETADAGIESLNAQVRYIRDFGAIEGGERQTWEGMLYYDAELERAGEVPARAPEGGEGGKEGAARRGFAVVFDKNVVNGQERSEKRAFVFDGEWLVEKVFDLKQMIRRRVVPPGEVADPLRIGEGPFPIPLGQKREDILRRFTVELRPAGDGFPEGKAPQAMQDAYQLRLVPREGMPEAREFREVRLWYRSADLLPRLARTVNVDGGSSEVFLINHNKNQPTPDGVFDTAPPPRAEGWDVQTEEFRGPVDNGR